MATTYEKIASVTVGSGGAASIEFTTIAATFDDLLVKLSGRSTSTSGAFPNANVYMQFNNSAATNYSQRGLLGLYDGSNNVAVSGSTSSTTEIREVYVLNANGTASTFNSAEYYIPNYAGSTNKSISFDGVTESNTGASAYTWFLTLGAGLWAQTAAINAIKFSLSSGNFAQHSTAVLYGIKKS